MAVTMYLTHLFVGKLISGRIPEGLITFTPRLIIPVPLAATPTALKWLTLALVWGRHAFEQQNG